MNTRSLLSWDNGKGSQEPLLGDPIVLFHAAPECQCGQEIVLVSDGFRVTVTSGSAEAVVEDGEIYVTCRNTITPEGDLCDELYPSLLTVSLAQDDCWVAATPEALAVLEKFGEE